MKLSNETLTILKQFSLINQSIIFKPGSVIRTISPQKTIMGSATVEEEFPVQVGIYNLPRLLSVCSLYEDADLQFHESYLTITEGKRNAKYKYCDASLIIAPDDKKVNFPEIDVSVELGADDLSKVLKASNVFQLPEIAFVGEGGKCYIRAFDSAKLEKEKRDSDSYDVELGETEDEFSLVIRAENINVLPSDYKIEISSKGISRFRTGNVEYYIAVENAKSSYTKKES